MSDMANNDLEKYGKALEKYFIQPFNPDLLNLWLQCYHEISHPEDGGGERYYEASLEQNVSGHR